MAPKNIWKNIDYGDPVVMAGWGGEHKEKNSIHKISPIFIAENSNSMDSKIVKGDSGSPVWYADKKT